MTKTVLITGGAGGIGREFCKLFNSDGYRIVVFSLLQEELDALGQQLKSQRADVDYRPVQMDLSQPGAAEEIIQWLDRENIELDVLVNNAAYQRHRDSLDDVSIEQWETTFRTNIFGYFYMVKYAVPAMAPGSTIINTGSVTGLEGKSRLLDYSSTKGAIHAFTKSLAQSLVEQSIRVNCVAPGPVWTPLNPAERSDEEMGEFGEATPLGRPGQPEEMEPAYVFFASDADSSYITGHVLPLLGGETTAG